jgi:hypothetical protein
MVIRILIQLRRKLLSPYRSSKNVFQLPKRKSWIEFEKWSQYYNDPLLTVWIVRSPSIFCRWLTDSAVISSFVWPYWEPHWHPLKARFSLPKRLYLSNVIGRPTLEREAIFGDYFNLWVHHSPKSSVAQIRELGHAGVFCDGCGQMMLRIRHRCAQCEDFDLCETCYVKPIRLGHTLESTHEFLKIPSGDSGPSGIISFNQPVEGFANDSQGSMTLRNQKSTIRERMAQQDVS